jgi:hypothetical protein
MIFKSRYINSIIFFLISFALIIPRAIPEESHVSLGEGMGMGMPLGGASEEADLDICPLGANVIYMFLAAWRKEDLKAMYDLIDEESKKDYPYEQARFDFQMLDFKEYKISSVKKEGENFEFILSHGSWKDGNKAIRKMIISGRTFKIIMSDKNSPFKRSIEDYF